MPAQAEYDDRYFPVEVLAGHGIRHLGHRRVDSLSDRAAVEFMPGTGIDQLEGAPRQAAWPLRTPRPQSPQSPFRGHPRVDGRRVEEREA
jgi:hypothetical protein